MSLKYYAKAYRRGSYFEVDGGLKQNLWSIIKTIDALYQANKLTKEIAKKVINDILRPEECQTVIYNNEPEPTPQRMTLEAWITEFIRQCETGERLKKKSTKKVTPGTIKSYKGTLAQLIEFQTKKHRKIDFDDVTMDFYDSWKRFFIDKNYSPNTIGRHIKNLKIFLFAADDMKLTTSTEWKSSRFSVDHEDVDNIYLTEERIQQMYDFDPTDLSAIKHAIDIAAKKDRAELKRHIAKEQQRKCLAEAKDVFVVGCLTGQRVSDYKRIDSSMIVTLRDGSKYISLQQEKTGKNIYIPLDKRVEAILDKYNGKLPKVYDQHLNERIKIVGWLLGWTESADITERRGLLEYDSGKKFYEGIKTHTARRSFATNAYKDGVPLSSIMAVTGHSSEAMLRKYLKLDNEERAIIAAADFLKHRKAQMKIVE
ncbi:site-specific integrase [Prevotella sp. E13-17]|uniref:tyrosine-type recombinase/integrase n=1 Tax=Prevotella sp. E13-17 TaxID=2913616 RepID=UPI001EDA7CB0|nr:tyrosine-type recombinase/integrase [Prevotella sp. E13-17]UKK52170.1 site-specific integrase [Prevotella sp. E13-17]